jgi:hypothetical protein
LLVLLLLLILRILLVLLLLLILRVLLVRLPLLILRVLLVVAIVHFSFLFRCFGVVCSSLSEKETLPAVTMFHFVQRCGAKRPLKTGVWSQLDDLAEPVE